MPTAGLSLVGFIPDQQKAIQHLRVQCVPPDPSDAALTAQWATAAQKLGTPIPNAGMPSINPVPAAGDSYIQSLANQPWVQHAFQQFGYTNPEFKTVEIDPLLAFQFAVDMDRSDFHCSGLSTPSLNDLLPICLPQTQPKLAEALPMITPINQNSTSFTMKVRNLNVRHFNKGLFTLIHNGYESWVAGLQIHVLLPFVQIVRFNGRCYLHNGFHRAYGARKAGATSIPCLFRDVSRPEDVGMAIDQTFDLPLLESANPPTVGHFTQNRAIDVALRSISRITHVTWSESEFPDENERMNP